MKFNGKKFQVMRYGNDEDLKNDTLYFTENVENIVERKETIRDLGVMMSDDASFKDQIEKVVKKVRQKTGWVLRTFYSRKTMFNINNENTLQDTDSATCRLLLATLDASENDGNTENRKITKRLPEQNTSTERDELLAEARVLKDDFNTKTTREIQDHVHMENPRGLSPELRDTNLSSWRPKTGKKMQDPKHKNGGESFSKSSKRANLSSARCSAFQLLAPIFEKYDKVLRR